MDPHGYAVPLGAHIRRMNPRDTAVNMNRRRIIRRGGTYGPPLPEGAAEDGVERGIAAFVGCASLIRQFEFAQNVWANDPRFHELGNERDPIIGAQDGSYDMTIPKRPIRKKITGLPAFTTVTGGAYFFLPGIRALRFLADGAAASAGANRPKTSQKKRSRHHATDRRVDCRRECLGRGVRRLEHTGRWTGSHRPADSCSTAKRSAGRPVLAGEFRAGAPCRNRACQGARP